MAENNMDTVLKRALHYVECYDMHFPQSGADAVVAELRADIAAQPVVAADVECPEGCKKCDMSNGEPTWI